MNQPSSDLDQRQSLDKRSKRRDCSKEVGFVLNVSFAFAVISLAKSLAENKRCLQENTSPT
jgi:hypothetical protein